jgi:hypothetical protein
VIVSELHYHPLPQDGIDDREFEFIELQNSGSSLLDLSLARFVSGIDYTFPVNTILQSGGYVMLVSNKYYFQTRYGYRPFDSYIGHLDNGGERIVLVDAGGDTLASFRYNDKNPWPESADGKGYSLILQKNDEPPQYDNAANWRASYRIHGSPGIADAVFVQDKKQTLLPEAFALQQNYPNPFNSITTIPFAVAKKSIVSVAVFNVSGQELEILVNREFAPGQYTIKWDASKRSSGVYLLRVRSSYFDKVIKAIIIN